MKKTFIGLILGTFVAAAYAAVNPAFILTDPSDGHVTGTIDGTTDKLNMVGGFSDNGTDVVAGPHTVDTDTFVTGKDAHDHVGGDGNQIDHDNLSNVSTSDHHIKTVDTDTFVTGKDAHDHVGGDGNQIDHDNLSNVSTSDHHVKAVSGDITHNSTVGGTTTDAHHAKAVSGDITHASTVGGTATSAHHVKTVDTNTNAQTICGTDLVLDGDGDCVSLTGGLAAPYVVKLATNNTPYQFNCVLMSDGTVRCAGAGTSGQLGNGAVVQRSYPVTLNFPADVTEVAIGDRHGLALLDDGTVWAWGLGNNGQMGDGSNTNNNMPGPVNTLTNVVKISHAGGRGLVSHSCALTSGGAVYAWGYNLYGQIGNGTFTTPVNTPYQLVASGAKDVECGGGNYGITCVLYDDDTLKCTGYNGINNLGDTTTTNRNVLTAVVKAQGGAAVADADRVFLDNGYTNGSIHNCYINTSDELRCWGYNGQGNYGTGDAVNRSSAVLVNTGVREVVIGNGAVGGGQTIAIMTDGTMEATGYDGRGGTGDGTASANNLSFGSVVGSHVVTKVTQVGGDDSTGYGGYCALDTGGKVWCWGYGGNYANCDGNATAANATPVQAGNFTNIVDIQGSGFANAGSLMMLDDNGTAWSCGGNAQGELGQNHATTHGWPNRFE
jgi:alpha-tubulin suppressor-like RCC1 family protein